MRFKHLLALAVIVGFSFCLLAPSVNALQEKNQEKKAPESNIIIIPDKVKTVLNEGLKTKQPRPDIPFSIVWHIYLPAERTCTAYSFLK